MDDVLRLEESHEAVLAALKRAIRREALEEAIDCCRQHAADDGTAQKIEAAIHTLLGDYK